MGTVLGHGSLMVVTREQQQTRSCDNLRCEARLVWTQEPGNLDGDLPKSFQSPSRGPLENLDRFWCLGATFDWLRSADTGGSPRASTYTPSKALSMLVGPAYRLVGAYTNRAYMAVSCRYWGMEMFED